MNLEAVLRLHQPQVRWQPSPDFEGSFDSCQEAAEYGDVYASEVNSFLVCKHCGEIELRQAGDFANYMAALWPCATVRALYSGPYHHWSPQPVDGLYGFVGEWTVRPTVNSGGSYWSVLDPRG